MVLLNIIGSTGVQAGAIKLKNGEDYVFAAQEKIADFKVNEKHISLDCRFDEKFILSNAADRNNINPCMFSRELSFSRSFFCTNVPAWHADNCGTLLARQGWCKKCLMFGYKTSAMVPIKAAGEILGLIHLYDTRKMAISAEEVIFLETISGPLGYALKHLQDRESIHRSEEQYRFLAENAKDIIFRKQLYPENKYLYISPASTFISGYSPEEYYADRSIDKKLIHPDDYPKYRQSFCSKASFRKPIILRLIHKDGRVIWMEFHCTPVAYTQGKVGIIEGIARDITGRVEAEQEIKASYEKLKTFSSMILRVQEEEKIRLSRELHDEAGQLLTALKLNLQVLKGELGGKCLNFQKRLSESIDLVDSILGFVHRQASSLRPPALDHMGLVATVKDMAQGFSHRTGIKAKVIATDEKTRFSNEIETALFRCIQESLTNTARHSEAQKVVVKLEFRSNSIEVCIEDNGKGFNPQVLDIAPHRLGLTGMQERVKLLNGSFTIDSRPRGGTRIKIIIPLV